MKLVGTFEKVFDWENNSQTDLSICIEIDKNMTLSDFLNKIQDEINIERYKMHCIELSYKYYNGIRWLNYHNELPYIIEQNTNIVRWSVNYSDIKLSDLLFTLRIENFIYLEIIPKGIGGLLFLNTIKEIWEIFIGSISSIIFFVDAINSFKYIKDKLIKKKANPVSFVTYIFSKDKWNLHELSESTLVDKENLKNILKGLGYKWDKEKLLYVKTEKSKIIYKKIINIDYKN